MTIPDGWKIDKKDLEMYIMSTDPAKKAVTFREVIDALERNGYTQGFGDFFQKNDNNQIVAACAVGQAAINLEVGVQSLYDALNNQFAEEIIDSGHGYWGDYIAGMNDGETDGETHSLKEIAEYLRHKLGAVESFDLIDHTFYISKHNYENEIAK